MNDLVSINAQFIMTRTTGIDITTRDDIVRRVCQQLGLELSKNRPRDGVVRKEEANMNARFRVGGVCNRRCIRCWRWESRASQWQQYDRSIYTVKFA